MVGLDTVGKVCNMFRYFVAADKCDGIVMAYTAICSDVERYKLLI